MDEQSKADIIARVDGITEDVIMEHKLTADTLRDITTVPGVHADQALTYNMLVGLMKKVEDEAYAAPLQYIAPSRRDEIPPEKYDTNNPFHYIQRYGRQGFPRPLPTITGRTLSEAEARAAMELGMRRAGALLSRIAGDSVSDVISRDNTGRFAAVSGDDQKIQHDQTPAETVQPAREGASHEESEAGAVNRNPQ